MVHPPEENPIKISPHTPLNVETENVRSFIGVLIIVSGICAGKKITDEKVL